MTHRLTTNYAKNYCNRTLIVKVIAENVVTCFFGTRCIYEHAKKFIQKFQAVTKETANNSRNYFLPLTVLPM